LDLDAMLANQTRFDAMRDLPVEFKWVGVGQSPQPTSKPPAVEFNGKRVELEWPENGWGVSRCFFVCPACGKRSRFVYVLDNGSMGCHEHVTARRKAKETALLGLRRASVLGRNRRYKARGKQLELASKAKLASLTR